MAERMIEEPATVCLVKYTTPVLVDKVGEKKQILLEAAEKPDTRVKLEPAQSEIEEILNTIIPPKEWDESGETWQQHVSTVPATRLDVVNLQEQLNKALQQCQARESGIDPKRRELFAQCYDEIIRQETINCVERGMLLLRVKDEMKVTIDAYKALYLSSVAFGMRKALACENQQTELQAEHERLVQEKTELERSYLDLKQKAEQTERRHQELRTAEEKQHAEEISFLKKTNQQLKAQLEGIVAPKKA